MCAGALSMRIKLTGHEFNEFISCIVQVKNGWSCNSGPAYAFIACTQTMLPLPKELFHIPVSYYLAA
jgi:hypothetical protein